jgi:hypothetical protein
LLCERREPMNAVEERWLSPAEAARALGLTPARIRQMMGSGYLPHQWTPIGRLVDAAAVEAIRAERERKAKKSA